MKVYVVQNPEEANDTTTVFTSKAKAEYCVRSANQSDFGGEEVYTVEVHEFEISKRGILRAISAGADICRGGDIGYEI
tara:strand:- start:11660 stop:11893 length:234 start_codon:yes stop_codon:yes gene_type:complete